MIKKKVEKFQNSKSFNQEKYKNQIHLENSGKYINSQSENTLENRKIK